MSCWSWEAWPTLCRCGGGGVQGFDEPGIEAVMLLRPTNSKVCCSAWQWSVASTLSHLHLSSPL
jgi:hypothetical protein